MKLTIIITLLFLASCATPYQKAGFGGGFSETQLSDNVFQVSFKGNAYTEKERAADFSLLRSAEIALDKGFKFFEIVNNHNSEQIGFIQTPVTANTTSYANTTGMLSAYGNSGIYNGSTFGNSTTTYSGGQIVSYSEPLTTNTIICYKNKPKDRNLVFDAEFIKSSIRTKYKLDAQS